MQYKEINISSGSYLSALFGVTEENAVIKNLYVYGNIENTNDTYGIAAGICAVNYGLISHCINYAEIKGENRVGGIVGYNGAVNKTVTSCVIAQCENKELLQVRTKLAVLPLTVREL